MFAECLLDLDVFNGYVQIEDGIKDDFSCLPNLYTNPFCNP
jgi:hypothetical protein